MQLHLDMNTDFRCTMTNYWWGSDVLSQKSTFCDFHHLKGIFDEVVCVVWWMHRTFVPFAVVWRNSLIVCEGAVGRHNRVFPKWISLISLNSVNHDKIQKWYGYQRYYPFLNRYITSASNKKCIFSLLPLGRYLLPVTTWKR